MKVDGDTAYVALKYIQKYTGIQYELMTDEVNRINIKTKFGTAETVTVKKNGNVRYRAGIKSPILTDVAKGDILYVLEEKEDVGDWTKVRTSNGFIGYIRNKYLGQKGEETTASNYTEPHNTNLSKDYTINMAWHQVTNADVCKLLPSEQHRGVGAGGGYHPQGQHYRQGDSVPDLIQTAAGQQSDR